MAGRTEEGGGRREERSITREWSIQEVARLAGTTSRTLRHYAGLGLVEPSRIGANGYRFYDERSLLRLQRVLLLRELGLGLPAIAEVLTRDVAAPVALRRHLEWLQAERTRLERQIASVRTTITTLEEKGDLMAETMFDGFDHTQHRAEVETRWGSDAYAAGDTWWRSKSEAERAVWKERAAALAVDWQAAAARGLDPLGEEGQVLARRQVDWLAGIPGTPGAAVAGSAAGGAGAGVPSAEYLTGLGELYVADDRFAANYGGPEGARFVRDALAEYARRHLA